MGRRRQASTPVLTFITAAVTILNILLSLSLYMVLPLWMTNVNYYYVSKKHIPFEEAMDICKCLWKFKKYEDFYTVYMGTKKEAATFTVTKIQTTTPPATQAMTDYTGRPTRPPKPRRGPVKKIFDTPPVIKLPPSHQKIVEAVPETIQNTSIIYENVTEFAKDENFELLSPVVKSTSKLWDDNVTSPMPSLK